MINMIKIQFVFFFAFVTTVSKISPVTSESKASIINPVLKIAEGTRVMKWVNIYSRRTGTPVNRPNKKKKSVQIPKNISGL